jgi:hypothetical protein
MAKQQEGARLVLNVDARAHCSPTYAEGIGDPFKAECEPVQVVPVLQEGKQHTEYPRPSAGGGYTVALGPLLLWPR